MIEVKKKLPPINEGSSKYKFNSSITRLLRLYHKITLFSQDKQNVYITSLKRHKYSVFVGKRKNPHPDKPILYLYQLTPERMYISSLFEIEKDSYLIEKDGIIAIAIFVDNRLILDYLTEGTKKDLDNLLKHKTLLRAVLGDEEL